MRGRGESHLEKMQHFPSIFFVAYYIEIKGFHFVRKNEKFSLDILFLVLEKRRKRGSGFS